MEKFRVCVGSYVSNNSDCIEYDIYYTEAKNLEEAINYSKKCIDNWNKENKYLIYFIENVEIEK